MMPIDQVDISSEKARSRLLSYLGRKVSSDIEVFKVHVFEEKLYGLFRHRVICERSTTLL